MLEDIKQMFPEPIGPAAAIETAAELATGGGPSPEPPRAPAGPSPRAPAPQAAPVELALGLLSERACTAGRTRVLMRSAG